jgi:putative two-component system response regulator
LKGPAENDVGNADKPRILIVDDIAANIKVLNEILGEEYSISFATEWRKGLDLARRVRPDIILLDVMMPEMDGYEICRRLKSETETRDIPVIFITARGSGSRSVAPTISPSRSGRPSSGCGSETCSS